MSTQGAGGFRAGAGRPKGALGEKTLAVQTKLEKLDCDPIEALAMIAKDTNNTAELRFQANKENDAAKIKELLSLLIIKT